MYLTDEELCMVEQLAYLDEAVAKIAGINNVFSKINMDDHRNSTISDILSDFNDTAIMKLMMHSESICDGVISGIEWARIISYLKNPENRVSQLVLRDIKPTDNVYHAAIKSPDTSEYIGIADYHDAYYGPEDATKTEEERHELVKFPLALCFTDGFDTNEAIIVYKGTTGPGEWKDNALAANIKNTGLQQAALEFAKDMVKRGFTSLTVVGHSKGSNKAMYTTILCDNVVRCVGFDGQGFSREFMSDIEVAKRIEERSHLITNYALSTDFVNILMRQLPGSKQVHISGFGVLDPMQNHSSNSFFVQDEYGKTLSSWMNSLYDNAELTTSFFNELAASEKDLWTIENYACSKGYPTISPNNIWHVFFQMYADSEYDSTELVDTYFIDYVNSFTEKLMEINDMSLITHSVNSGRIPTLITVEQSENLKVLNHLVLYLTRIIHRDISKSY